MPLSCTVKQLVNAPAEVVFAAASDFANAPSRITGITKMEMLTTGPVGVGTRFRETRVMFGKQATETMEVIDFKPGRSYTLGATSHGCTYRTTLSVRPVAGGSEVELDFIGTPLTFSRKVMAALMGWMINKACVKAIGQDLSDLKASVEREAVPAARST
ncbi:MAG: SRPBCC family protein [Phycisphaeraceae bacterium]|nr:SRPBCC family protein [Phycisphaeraceae bacterium]